MPAKQHLMHGRDHLAGGADPIPNLPPNPAGGDSLDSLILAAVPDGFWKLNESSGTVAADSSGNGVDMSSVSFIPPVWAQPSGPPGQQTADFNTGSGSSGSGWARVHRTWAVLSADFTAGVWAKRDNTNGGEMFGQGNVGRSGGSGWQLAFTSAGTIPANVAHLDAKGPGTVYGLNPVTPGNWVFLAATYKASSGEWKLYVNGLLQGSMTGTFAPAGLPDLWIGHDGAIGLPLGGHPSDSTLSYAFLINRTLTGSELLAMNDSTVPVDRTNYVLTINGSGQQEWLPSMIEVEY